MELASKDAVLVAEIVDWHARKKLLRLHEMR